MFVLTKITRSKYSFRVKVVGLYETESGAYGAMLKHAGRSISHHHYFSDAPVLQVKTDRSYAITMSGYTVMFEITEKEIGE